MKTAMQELRLELQSYCGDEIFDEVYKKLFDWHIEKEKEQLIDAWDKSRMLIDWPTDGHTFYHTKYSKPPKK